MTDYYFPDKCHSYKYYDSSSSTTTKNSTNFPSNVALAALDHSELAAPFFLSPMNGSGWELGLDDQQHYYVVPSSSNNRNSTGVPTSTETSHTDDHGDVATWIRNDQRQLLPPMPSLIRLQEQEYQQSLPLLQRDSTATTTGTSSSSTNRHDEDIRLEIIQTFFYYS
jgi:hypothetical protein